MHADSKHNHDHRHDHEHKHEQAHAYAYAHAHDLKSPVLSGVLQRLLWSCGLLVVLWLVVLWALHSNG